MLYMAYTDAAGQGLSKTEPWLEPVDTIQQARQLFEDLNCRKGVVFSSTRAENLTWDDIAQFDTKAEWRR